MKYLPFIIAFIIGGIFATVEFYIGFNAGVAREKMVLSPTPTLTPRQKCEGQQRMPCDSHGKALPTPDIEGE